MLPLRDAAKIPSCSYSRGGAAIRSGVVAAAAPSIQSFLKTFPPADDFFGYPTQQLAALMDFTVMVASLAPRAPAPRRPPPPRTAPPSRPQARSAPSSPTVVASSAVSGRLQTFLDAWKDIRAPSSVLQIIEGYRIPFTRPPPLSLPVSTSFTVLTRKELIDLMRRRRRCWRRAPSNRRPSRRRAISRNYFSCQSPSVGDPSPISSD